mmetsp:Transcript_61804/g.146226  ORF Transcript_61804/g.146226 Transcript_61804/m.146226 type:complete len:381 (-) Transcript_61804:1210-2352(-)
MTWTASPGPGVAGVGMGSGRRGTALWLRQPPHIGCQHTDLLRREALAMGRHHVVLAVVDHRRDGLLAPAVQPDLVGQVGCAEGLVALALRAVAGCADDELLLAELGVERVVRAARQRQHIVGDVADILAAAYRGRHHRHIALAALGDALDDGVEAAAPEPVVIGQVGKALGALGVGAMALRTVVGEQPLADGMGLGIPGELLRRLARKRGIDRRHRGACLCDLLVMLADAGPAELAGLAAQARVKREVDAGEHDGQHEQAHPPRRQRVVEFAQVLVPDMAGGVVGGHHLPTACDDEQDAAGDEAADGRDRDEQGPAAAEEVAHGSSPSKGRRAASSNRPRQAQAMMPMKTASDTRVTTVRSVLMSTMDAPYLFAVPSTCR